MKNRTLFTVALLFILGIIVLFVVNFSSLLMTHSSQDKYLKQTSVKGVAVEYQNLLYTLNFEQQKALVEMLNHSIRVVGVKPDKRKKPEISKIIIYQFEDEPEIIITPVAYINQNLVYSAPYCNPGHYLMEINDGLVAKLLAQTYGP